MQESRPEIAGCCPKNQAPPAGYADGAGKAVEQPIRLTDSRRRRLGATFGIYGGFTKEARVSVEPGVLAPTLDGRYYTEPGILDAEFERIFEREWYYVGRADEIPAPGRYIRRRVGRETVVLVRGRDQVIRGFLNVCRHRGAQLCLTDSGQVGRTIRCPYHAWTYSLDGQLVAAPLAGAGRHGPRPLPAAPGTRRELGRADLGQPRRAAGAAARATAAADRGPAGRLREVRAVPARRPEGRGQGRVRRGGELEADLREFPGVLSLPEHSPGAGDHDPAVQVAGHRDRRLRSRRLPDRSRPSVVLAHRADRAAQAARPAARRRPAVLRHGCASELFYLAGRRPRDPAQGRARRAGSDPGWVRVAVSGADAKGRAVRRGRRGCPVR